MRNRGRTALGIGVLVVGLGLAAATPAAADTPTTWEKPPAMSTLEALLIFVGIPAGLFVVIALLVMAPSVAKGPRYRPGLSWWADPEWFNGPDGEGEERPALERGTSDPVGATAVSQLELSDATVHEGGAGARW